MPRRGSVHDSILSQPCTPYRPTMRPTTTRRSAVIASGGRLQLGLFLDQCRDLVAHLRALGDPGIDALDVELHAPVLAGRDRVVIAHVFNVAPVTLAALIGHDDVIKRAPFGAA